MLHNRPPTAPVNDIDAQPLIAIRIPDTRVHVVIV